MNDLTRVFVYGTLMPGHGLWPVLKPYVAGTPIEAVAMGDLYDYQGQFPAMFPGDRRVPGYVVTLLPERAAEALAKLDRIEGTAAGFYVRETATVATPGGDLEAWVYYGKAGILRDRPITSWAERGVGA